MKKFSFLRYTAGMLGVCLAFTLASCSSDDDNYTPGEPTAAGAVGAYFDSKNASTFVLSPEDETIELTLSRSNTQSAVTVPIIATGEGAKALQVPESVSFAAGEASQTLSIGVKGLEVKKQYALNLAIDESQADHYTMHDGTSSLSCTVVLTQWTMIQGSVQFYFSGTDAIEPIYSDLWQLEGMNSFYLTNFLGSGANLYFTLSGSDIDFNDPATLKGEVVPVNGQGALTYDYGDYGYKLHYVSPGVDENGDELFAWTVDDTYFYYVYWYGGYSYSSYSWLDFSNKYFSFNAYASTYSYSAADYWSGYTYLYGVW